MKLRVIPIRKKRKSNFKMPAWPQNWQRKVLKFLKSSTIKDIKEGTLRNLHRNCYMLCG